MKAIRLAIGVSISPGTSAGFEDLAHRYLTKLAAQAVSVNRMTGGAALITLSNVEQENVG